MLWAQGAAALALSAVTEGLLSGGRDAALAREVAAQ
jgi:hypothetical protein